MFDEDRRLLAGMHDVDAFVEGVAPFGRAYVNFKPERSVMIRR
jgi:hypothetical protein